MRKTEQEETKQTEISVRSSVISVSSCLILFFLLSCSSAFAHEMRPAYLELRETKAETYDVLWKVPGRGENLRLGLYVEFPADCKNVTDPRGTMINNALAERWTVHRAGGLTGGTIHIAGLSACARASGASRRHGPNHPAYSSCSVLRGGSRSRSTGSRPHLHRARHRTHPHRN